MPGILGAGPPEPVMNNPQPVINNQEQPVEKKMSESNQQVVDIAAAAKEGESGLSPEELSQYEAYTDNATIVIYSEDSQPAILQEMQLSDVPAEGVAIAANHVHEILANGLQETGEQLSGKTLFLGGVHIISELIMLAEAADVFVLNNNEKMDALQATMRTYFEKGLIDGTIDPVELQKEIEPLMTDKQKEIGKRMMQENGISKTPPPSGPIWKGTGKPPEENRSEPGVSVPAGLLQQRGE